MKSDLEMTAAIVQQLRERRAAQKKRRTVLGLSAGTLAVAVVAVGVVWGTALHRKPDVEPTIGVSLVTTPALGGGSQTVPQPGAAPETVADEFGGASAMTPATSPAGEETSVAAFSLPENSTTVCVTSGAVSTTAAPTTAVPAVIYESAVTSSAAEQPSTTQNCTTSAVLSGGNSDLYVLPEKSAKEQLKRSGEKLTDKQAKAYFKDNLSWLQSALSASGVPAENLRVSDRGYSHVYFENFANSGKRTPPVCAIRQNFRDYPVWNGDELVAIVTLVQENGEIYATPAFGGAWFRDFGAFLNEHKGEKLLFLYFGGQTEFVLTPDGKVRNPQGMELAPDFGSIAQPYAFFYCDEAVYVP